MMVLTIFSDGNMGKINVENAPRFSAVNHFCVKCKKKLNYGDSGYILGTYDKRLCSCCYGIWQNFLIDLWVKNNDHN